MADILFMPAALKTVRAYLACPSCVYCRGHHLPSVSLYISAGTHHPPHPQPWLPIGLPMRLFWMPHHTSACVLPLCVPFPLLPNRLLLQWVFKTKSFDTPGLFQNKWDKWEAQLLGYLDPVRAFVACFYVVKLDAVLYTLLKIAVL